ncbi:MAG: hypothetical protein R3B09_11185 [Nannocystaceae bacterium]
MSASSTALVARLAAPFALYRDDAYGERGLLAAATPHLEAADEALQFALLTLTTDDDGDRPPSVKMTQAAQARSFLAEACVAFGRARVFMPSVHTYTLAVVMSAEPNVDQELLRLHQLATRLLWVNLSALPARRQAAPLGPEDEAQLALVVAGLARHARIDRLLRLSWLPLTALLAALGPLYGVPLFGLVVALVATTIAGSKLAQMQRRDLAGQRAT